jgi:hypothetical protein
VRTFSVLWCIVGTVLLLASCDSHAGPSFAALDRRFDRGRVGVHQQRYLWQQALIWQVRPELFDSGALSQQCLRDEPSGDPLSREWCIRNRRGLPVKPRPEFFHPFVNFVTKDAPEYVLRTTAHEGFDRLTIFVESGEWQVETRLADFDFSIWQPVGTLGPGAVGVYLFEHDFLRHEYRIVPLP